jgi:pimeloyl-ACP methyl ester carboxylesterase
MPTISNIYYTAYTKDDTGWPPVVLIHGAGGSHLDWPPELRRMPGQHVYALDLPGHGKSEGLGRQSISAYMDALLAWLDAMHIDRAVLIGHSMGSAIAMTTGLEHPERTAGLVLVGSGARLRVLPEILENTSSSLTFQKAIDTILQKSYSPSAEPHLRSLTARQLEATRNAVLHGDYQACNSFDIMERVCEIQAKTLMICGADDEMTPPRYAQYLARQIPNAQLAIIPDAGHMVMLEQPQAVAVAVMNFLPRLR